MISAFAVTSNAVDDPDLRGDLHAAGLNIAGLSSSRAFVQEVIRSAADVIVCYEKHPDDVLFTNLTMLAASAPRPVVIFTRDPDAAKIEQAAEAGIHAYVVDGYAPNRLRAVIHVAQARFRREQKLRAELAEVNIRFDERKLVDRAKGILMRARQISEDEAYRVLRTAAMQTKQRLGQVAQYVINAALYSDAVNRAGQLRMLSQRLVKLYALRATADAPSNAKAQLEAAVAQIDENIGILRRGLSKPTFGDLIDSAATPWAPLKAAVHQPALLSRLPEIDRLADDLLDNAERLTANLETAGLATKLRVINVAGRQRMLAQKIAKLALLSVMVDDPPGQQGQSTAIKIAAKGARTGRGPGAVIKDSGGKAGGVENKPPREAAMREAVSAFTLALDYLKTLPLSTPAIRQDLEAATELWAAFQAALPASRSPGGQAGIASLSDELVEKFDKLTDHYERGLQMLLE